MAKALKRGVEMEQCEVEAIVKRKYTIFYRITLLEKGIKIPNSQ
jgi:hypothetical protein